MEAALIPNGAGGVFQHGVDIGAELGGVNGSLLPLLCPQTVVEKIGQAALGLFVDLGGGQIQAVAIEASDVLPGNRPQGIIRPGKGRFIFCLLYTS